MANPLCTQTVTVYSAADQGITRQVVSGCFYQYQRQLGIDGLEDTKFLLILPADANIAPGDRVYDGIGPAQVVWEAFLPVNTHGLAQVEYVQPQYFRGRLHHIEAGRR